MLWQQIIANPLNGLCQLYLSIAKRRRRRQMRRRKMMKYVQVIYEKLTMPPTLSRFISSTLFVRFTQFRYTGKLHLVCGSVVNIYSEREQQRKSPKRWHFVRWTFPGKWFKWAFFAIVESRGSHIQTIYSLCDALLRLPIIITFTMFECVFFSHHFFPRIKVLLSWKTGILFKLLFDERKKNGDISWTEAQKHRRKQERKHKWATLFCIYCVAHITRAYIKSTQKFIWDQARPRSHAYTHAREHTF